MNSFLFELYKLWRDLPANGFVVVDIQLDEHLLDHIAGILVQNLAMINESRTYSCIKDLKEFLFAQLVVLVTICAVKCPF